MKSLQEIDADIAKLKEENQKDYDKIRILYFLMALVNLCNAVVCFVSLYFILR